MKKILTSLFVLVLLAGCLPNPGSPSVPTAQPSPTAYPVQPTYTAYPTFTAVVPATESATPETLPSATLEPTVTATQNAPFACIQDNSTTSFADRDPLVVNGVKVALQVRDANCPRATYHDETGVATGQQYKIDVPKGYSIAFAAVTCQVAEDGKAAVDYLDTPFILIRGPWRGSLGCYEAGVHGLPSEWEDYLTKVIKPIHDSEVGHTVPLTLLTGE